MATSTYTHKSFFFLANAHVIMNNARTDNKQTYKVAYADAQARTITTARQREEERERGKYVVANGKNSLHAN